MLARLKILVFDIDWRDMSKSVRNFHIFGAVFSILTGSLLHFLFEWSGGSHAVALVGAVNESSWEHLKIAFWPMFVFAVIEYFMYGRKKDNFLLAKSLGILAVPIIIIILFYGWLTIFPDNVIYDISIFALAIILGYYKSYKILQIKNLHLEFAGLLILILLLASFSFFTYFPAKNFLFRDPVTNGYGIIGESSPKNISRIPSQTCPDKERDDRGDMLYVNGKAYYSEQEDWEWIVNNCADYSQYR